MIPRLSRVLPHQQTNQEHGMCEKYLPGLTHLNYWWDRQRTQLEDGDHSGNDTHLVPDFLHQYSGMFPERFRKVTLSVGSKKFV